jgi:uncharacterized membrane protein
MPHSALSRPAHAPDTPRAPSPDRRIEAVDILRGLVMALMALDHTRDYLHAGQLQGQDPLDFATTHTPLFLTRWITHYCAPVFLFLAGSGAFLSRTRERSLGELSRFLLTRGAWLIFLELTVIHWAGWAFTIDLHLYLAIVIWVIGWSMIVLAGLVHLPLWAIAAFGGVLIAGHNLLDNIRPETWGSFAWLWRLLHAGGPVELAPGYLMLVGYPLIPWVGVMALGYAFGAVLQQERGQRRSFALRAGVGLTIVFVFLRFSNLYGDPRPWSEQATGTFTFLSLLNCHKYPPSLCYLLMTLGPALVLLALIDRERTPAWLKPLAVFGRVPLFYYLLHLLALLIETYRFGSAPWLIGVPFAPGKPAAAGAGFALPGVYLAWLIALAVLYPACVWFAELKRRRRDAWLSYL